MVGHPSSIIFVLYITMKQIDLKQFKMEPGDRVPAGKKSTRQHRVKPAGRFLGVPISWDWLSAVAHQPGRALHVAIVLRFLAGLNRSQTVALSSQELLNFGVSRKTGYRALKALQTAGLVTVDQKHGRHPRVTIVETPAPTEGGQL